MTPTMAPSLPHPLLLVPPLPPPPPQGALTLCSFPGRLPEVRPYRYDRERIVSATHAGRIAGLRARKGIPAKTPGGRDANYGWGAFERLWQWKSWSVERTGPAYPSLG